MGKITFRADDDLVDELEAFDASKSEVMREALRAYLDVSDGASARRRGARETAAESGAAESSTDALVESIDELLRERVDALLESRLAERRGDRGEVNVTVALDGVDDRQRKTRADRAERTAGRSAPESTARAPNEGGRQCKQCGERVDDDHVYCPNCGEKASRRLFCECGDEIRSDWSFCPGCGRRTPAADVLDSNRPEPS
ncbi:double zinc ribbon domain-containing protein [Salinilacihabitans rarus]|uniref:double zinc ribbon domain-containing protein n=1 Tax=Salinilacihabitans rarus TaxID=2961596 RepID=UPI0020C85EB5|nr:zinc ribbon domain-containing protein [Salinilacihabitans rarus]